MSGLLTSEVKEFNLLSNECAMDFLDFDAITTATIYNGSPRINALKARVNVITALNPWLAGRLLKKKNSAQVTVQYPTGASPEADFLILDDLKFTDPFYNPVQHNPDFEHYFVQKGTACLNKDKPLFRVIVAILNPTQYVLFVSMSHAVADGSTYYSIYNMLSSTVSPRALTMERDEACAMMIRSIGLEEAAFFKSAGFIANAVGKMICHGKHHMAYCKVKPEWLETQKEEYQQRRKLLLLEADAEAEADAAGEEEKEENSIHSHSHSSSLGEVTLRLYADRAGSLPPPPFISANDILTSAVFKALHADFGVMPVNYRDRVEGLTAEHCGNYESVVGYCKVDYQQPEHIRASITKRQGGPVRLPVPASVRATYATASTPTASPPASSQDIVHVLGRDTATLLRGQYRRLRSDKPILPTFCAKRKAILSFATNWAGFYEQIVLEGSEHVTHFPVFISNAAIIPGAVIYKSDQDTLNILAVQGKPVFVETLVQLGAVEVI